MTSVRIITSKVLSGTRSKFHENPHPSVEEIIDAPRSCWNLLGNENGFSGLFVSLCVCLVYLASMISCSGRDYTVAVLYFW